MSENTFFFFYRLANRIFHDYPARYSWNKLGERIGSVINLKYFSRLPGDFLKRIEKQNLTTDYQGENTNDITPLFTELFTESYIDFNIDPDATIGWIRYNVLHDQQ